MNGKRRKGVILVSILLCALALFGLSGCTDDPQNEPEPIDGGTTDHTDANAPKTIASKDITGFDVDLFLSNRWRGEEDHFFSFRIKDENGVLTASEERSGASLPADAALLTALQNVIDEYDLAQFNGVYRVTAGLPPEYQERTLRVEYASGETLSFTENNEPEALWAERFYEVFADWFAANGDESLRPARETSLLTRLDLRMKEGSVWTEYGGINVPEETAIDGQTYLLQQDVYNEALQETTAENYIAFPEGHFEALTEILDRHDVVLKYDFSRYDREAHNYGNHDEGYFGFGSKTTADGEEDSEDLYLHLYAEYESGRRMTIETRKASEIEGLKPLLEDLLAYFEPLFGE